MSEPPQVQVPIKTEQHHTQTSRIGENVMPGYANVPIIVSCVYAFVVKSLLVTI